MSQKKKILYLQHAGSLGGSCISLLWTIKALNPEKYEPIVALIRPTPSVMSLYRDNGIKTLEWPGIYTFEHTTASWYSFTSPLSWSAAFHTTTGWHKSQQRTLELIEFTRPDIVHLNSVVLVPSAIALNNENIPFVWHVREATVRGYLGVRTRLISNYLNELPTEAIFISNYDKQSWVSGNRGIVIPNFVDFKMFDRQRSGDSLRYQLGIDKNTNILLYLGGLAEIKGIYPLLEALSLVNTQRTDWLCIMPSSKYQPTNKLSSRVARSVLPLIGRGTLAQQVIQKITEFGIEDKLIMLPFTRDVVPYYAACNMLLFPATRPHFARPVIEAASMGKPSIGSNIGGVNELITHNQNGLLVEQDSGVALSKAILKLMCDKTFAHQLGENAYHTARKNYDAQRNVRMIEYIYDTILTVPELSKKTYPDVQI